MNTNILKQQSPDDGQKTFTQKASKVATLLLTRIGPIFLAGIVLCYAVGNILFLRTSFMDELTQIIASNSFFFQVIGLLLLSRAQELLMDENASLKRPKRGVLMLNYGLLMVIFALPGIPRS